jgi:hypothetical protein
MEQMPQIHWWLLSLLEIKSNTAFNSVSSSFDFDEKNDFICSSQKPKNIEESFS